MSQVFCANVGSPPTAPWVGIANYGPEFVGVDAIRTLFSQIFFVTFPDVQFQPNFKHISALLKSRTGYDSHPSHALWYPGGVLVSAAVARVFAANFRNYTVGEENERSSVRRFHVQ